MGLPASPNAPELRLAAVVGMASAMMGSWGTARATASTLGPARVVPVAVKGWLTVRPPRVDGVANWEPWAVPVEREMHVLLVASAIRVTFVRRRFVSQARKVVVAGLLMVAMIKPAISK